MGSGVVVGIGTFFPTHRRIQGLEGADGRNGTVAGKFGTVAGFCRDEVFAAGQPGCMSISESLVPSSYIYSFLVSSRFSFPLPRRTSAFNHPAHDSVTSPNSPGTDHILNKIFTSLYGWIAILISFFLATVCVIKEVSPIDKMCREGADG